MTIDVPDGKFPPPLRTNKIEVPVRMTEPTGSPAKCVGVAPTLVPATFHTFTGEGIVSLV